MAERGRAPLPAPYESPWTLLRRDLRALAASGRLKILELRRRNAGGELPLPAFWPRALAPLFWPLVLAGLLALLVLLLSSLPPRRPAAPAAAPSGGLESAGPLDPVPGAPPVIAATEPEPAEPEPAQPVPAQPQAAEPEEPPPQEPRIAESEPSPAEPSPLAAPYAADLQQLAAPPEAGAHWLEAEPLAGQGGLRLRLGEPYGSLPERQREQLAALWWQRAQEEGWERLELVDPQGRRLGQSARLGSGMILLDPHLLP